MVNELKDQGRKIDAVDKEARGIDALYFNRCTEITQNIDGIHRRLAQLEDNIGSIGSIDGIHRRGRTQANQNRSMICYNKSKSQLLC
jgi:hypothetical protein